MRSVEWPGLNFLRVSVAQAARHCQLFRPKGFERLAQTRDEFPVGFTHVLVQEVPHCGLVPLFALDQLGRVGLVAHVAGQRKHFLFGEPLGFAGQAVNQPLGHVNLAPVLGDIGQVRVQQGVNLGLDLRLQVSLVHPGIRYAAEYHPVEHAIGIAVVQPVEHLLHLQERGLHAAPGRLHTQPFGLHAGQAPIAFGCTLGQLGGGGPGLVSQRLHLAHFLQVQQAGFQAAQVFDALDRIQQPPEVFHRHFLVMHAGGLVQQGLGNLGFIPLAGHAFHELQQGPALVQGFAAGAFAQVVAVQQGVDLVAVFQIDIDAHTRFVELVQILHALAHLF